MAMLSFHSNPEVKEKMRKKVVECGVCGRKATKVIKVRIDSPDECDISSYERCARCAKQTLAAVQLALEEESRVREFPK